MGGSMAHGMKLKAAKGAAGTVIVFVLAAAVALSGIAARGKQLGTGSAAKTAAKTEKLPSITFEKYKLKNGLEVILSEDHALPLVSVNVWYHVGPAYEAPGRT